MRTDLNPYLVFSVAERLYGLSVGCVERVVLTPYITSLPDPPEGLLGVFNLHGDSIPVLNLRQRFGLENRALTLSDPLILCRLGDRRLALWADEVHGVWTAGSLECVEPDCVWPGLEDLCGVAHVGAEVVAVLDPDFLQNEHRRMTPEDFSLVLPEGE